MIHNDLLFVLLVFEWWLGAQKWINAKSTIGLVVLIFGLIIFFIKNSTKGK